MGLPVMLDVTGWPVLVVGGGRIGCRRAAALVEAGADVAVLCANPTVALPEGVTHLAEDWSDDWGREPGDGLARWRIVVAATDDAACNRAIVEWAESFRAITLRVDRDRSPGLREARSSAAMGVAHRDGPITAAVFSGGAAPGLSRWLLDTFAARWPEGIGALATCAADAAALAAVTDPSARTHLSLADWQSLDVGEMLDAVRESHLDLVKERLAACLSS